MKSKISLLIPILACAIFPAAAFDFGTLNLGKALDAVKKVRQATSEISEPQEIALGQGIASTLLGAAPLLKNKRVQEYVNKVGRWLSLHTERPDLPWQFAVLDDNDVNAFATPGGNIFITNGLFMRMKSEAELAGVLAHEMSHVLKKHHLQAIKKSARTELISDFAGEVMDKNDVNPALKKLVSAGTEVYARGLDKGDEFEADRMGVVIAARGGYDPYGLPAVLQTLHSLNTKDSTLALMFKTHPALDDRLGLLDKLMSEAFDRFESQPDLAPRFMAVLDSAGLKAK